MKYILTGNFQYDLGIYGLKKIFDFFEENYETDNSFFIKTDKKPEEILELIFLYRFYQQKEKFKNLFNEINTDLENLPKFKSFSQLEEKVLNFKQIKAIFFRTLALSFQNEF